MRRVVIDASLGVKWFRSEPGSDEARALLREAFDGAVEIIVCSHFCYEYVSVAAREDGRRGALDAWRTIHDAPLIVTEVSDALMTAAAEQCEILGCSFYDALAPALAALVDAPLYSADRRAHGSVPGVVLIG